VVWEPEVLPDFCGFLLVAREVPPDFCDPLPDVDPVWAHAASDGVITSAAAMSHTL